MKRLSLTLLSALAALAPAMGSRRPIPIVLDTDIGTDIDDAFALALIVRSPELDLVGVTTVSGDTQARARIAAKLLWACGGKWRAVPVYAGPPGRPQPIEQARWARDFASPALHLSGAVPFLDKTFESRPGKVTLVAIGALTNVAALLRRDPAAARAIPEIALMGGSIAEGYAPGKPADPEWNIVSDVPAAQAVFSSGIPLIMAPLDVTNRLRLGRDRRERIFSQGTPLTDGLGALYRLWGRETPVLYDPMAVAMLIRPDLCSARRLAVSVDARGYTLAAAGGAQPNALVGLHGDPEAFFGFCLSRLAPLTDTTQQ